MTDAETGDIPYPELIAASIPPFDQHPVVNYLFGLGSDRSRAVMAQSLRSIVSILGGSSGGDADFMAINWGAVRQPHTQYIRERLEGQYRPATTNRILSALRGVLKEAWRLGQMDAEDYRAAVAIASITGTPQASGRILSPAEIGALAAACKADPSPAGARDAAIIGLMYACGLRRSEVVALNIEDFDRENNVLVIRSDRNEARTLAVEGGALAALLDCIDRTERTSGPLFVPVLKGARITERRMNAQSVYDMLRKRAHQAGVRSFSPHDLRRTFISGLLERGTDLSTAASLAGHSSSETTLRYERQRVGLPQDSQPDFPY